MKTTITVEGFPEMVLQKAVDAGIARSKTDAIRLGILELNRRYRLDEGDLPEADLVIAKIKRVEARNKALGLKPETEEEVLKRYPHLRKVMEKSK